MKLLLVEDEAYLSKIVAKGLRKCGYAVDTAMDGEEALYCFETNEYDLIVLDLNLPKIDGLTVLENIRRQDKAAKILILSARSAIHERVQGLNAGANDYLVKPFDFKELEARVANLLRWSFTRTPTVLSHCGVDIDTAAKTVSIDGRLVELTKKEFSILEYLMCHANTVISSEELIEHVWDSEADLFSNALKTHVYSLKKKLGRTDIIKNIRGQGYVIEE